MGSHYATRLTIRSTSHAHPLRRRRAKQPGAVAFFFFFEGSPVQWLSGDWRRHLDDHPFGPRYPFRSDVRWPSHDLSNWLRPGLRPRSTAACVKWIHYCTNKQATTHAATMQVVAGMQIIVKVFGLMLLSAWSHKWTMQEIGILLFGMVTLIYINKMEAIYHEWSNKSILYIYEKYLQTQYTYRNIWTTDFTKATESSRAIMYIVINTDLFLAMSTW